MGPKKKYPKEPGNSHLLPDLQGPKIQVLSLTLVPVQYSVPLLEQYDQEEGLPSSNIVTSTSPIMSEIHQSEYLNRVIQQKEVGNNSYLLNISLMHYAKD